MWLVLAQFTLPKNLVAKILVMVLLAQELANIGKKNKLDLAKNKDQFWAMTKILFGYNLAII